jgi:hypothetical protein
MSGNVFERNKEQQDHRHFAKTNMEALDANATKNLKFSEDLATLFGTAMENPPTLAVPAELETNPSELKRK